MNAAIALKRIALAFGLFISICTSGCAIYDGGFYAGGGYYGGPRGGGYYPRIMYGMGLAYIPRPSAPCGFYPPDDSSCQPVKKIDPCCQEPTPPPPQPVMTEDEIQKRIQEGIEKGNAERDKIFRKKIMK